MELYLKLPVPVGQLKESMKAAVGRVSRVYNTHRTATAFVITAARWEREKLLRNNQIHSRSCFYRIIRRGILLQNRVRNKGFVGLLRDVANG